MYGFLYRDLRLSRPMLLSTALMLLFTILAPIFAALNLSDDCTEIFEYNFISFMCYAMNMAFCFFVQGELHKSDEKRLPVCFAIASPAGANGYVKSKYISNFMVPFSLMNICLLTEQVALTIVDLNTKEVHPQSFNGIYTMIFLILLLLNSIELPFMFRFGVKKGANIKAAVFLSIFAGIGIYLLFGDISMFGSMDDFMQFLLDLVNGVKGGSTMVAIIAISPLVTFAFYYLSYLISCKLYLKGVEQLEQ